MTTARRARIWTTFDSSVGVSALGPLGQQAVKIGANILSGLGISHLAGYTVGPFFLELMILTDDGNTIVEEVTAHCGIGIFDGGIDEGDFPDLENGDGDYLLRENMVFQSPGATDTLVRLDTRASRRVISRSQRRLERVGDTVWIVFQHSTANDIDYYFSVTFMLLMP